MFECFLQVTHQLEHLPSRKRRYALTLFFQVRTFGIHHGAQVKLAQPTMVERRIRNIFMLSPYPRGRPTTSYNLYPSLLYYILYLSYYFMLDYGVLWYICTPCVCAFMTTMKYAIPHLFLRSYNMLFFKTCHILKCFILCLVNVMP